MLVASINDATGNIHADDSPDDRRHMPSMVPDNRSSAPLSADPRRTLVIFPTSAKMVAGTPRADPYLAMIY